MARPQDPLLSDLVDVFSAVDRTDKTFLDLPRALVVSSIPEGRPARDFVEIPPQPSEEVVQDLHHFLSERDLGGDGVRTNASIDDIETYLTERGLREAFVTFRRGISRQRIQSWLEEQGVIYT